VRRTAGVTASFIKEMMRKSALLSAIASDGDGRIIVTDDHLSAALDEMLDERSTLNRILLGGGGESEHDRPGRVSRPSF
jgi:DNA-binding transcriptional regulator/RsmH inhibitor MraZ